MGTRKNPEWKDCKFLFTNPRFIQMLTEFDRDNVPQATLAKIRNYTRKAEFDPDNFARRYGNATA